MASGASRASCGRSPARQSSGSSEIRHAEASKAAEALGATFESLDLGDYPLLIDEAAIERIIALIIETAPDVILTHTDRDPFNPDHPVAYAATERARILATGAGVASAFKTVRPPEFLLFEPHQPELCNFMPTTFLDITPVFEQKQQAMAAMGAQEYLRQYYTERAAHRANHARRISGAKDILYAEAFMRVLPHVVSAL